MENLALIGALRLAALFVLFVWGCAYVLTNPISRKLYISFQASFVLLLAASVYLQFSYVGLFIFALFIAAFPAILLLIAVPILKLDFNIKELKGMYKQVLRMGDKSEAKYQ